MRTLTGKGDSFYEAFSSLETFHDKNHTQCTQWNVTFGRLYHSWEMVAIACQSVMEALWCAQSALLGQIFFTESGLRDAPSVYNSQTTWDMNLCPYYIVLLLQCYSATAFGLASKSCHLEFAIFETFSTCIIFFDEKDWKMIEILALLKIPFSSCAASAFGPCNWCGTYLCAFEGISWDEKKGCSNFIFIGLWTPNWLVFQKSFLAC